MKKDRVVFAALTILLSAGSAKAWNCPSGEIRQQAPAGTPTTAPNYDVVEGIAFICVSSTPPTTPSNSSNSTSNSASNSSSASNSASNSASSAANKTKVTATGGNATATATGGSVGNISNTQHQSQSQSLTNSGNSSAMASGNGNNSDNSTYIVPKQVASAIAPSVAPTTPCFKGYSGGGQSTAFGFSFGGGKIDQNCSRLESSRLAPSLVARCKIFITVKWAKQAGVTMEDCLGPTQVESAAPIQVESAPTPVFVQPITVNIPPPVVVSAPSPSVVAAKKMIHKRPICKCVYTNDGPVSKP